MFKKLLKKLYLKHCDPDLVGLTRKQMQGVVQEFKVDELDPSERKIIANEAITVLQNPAFLAAMNNVKRRLMAHIQEEAPDATVIFVDRWCINGASMVQEELENYAMIDLEVREPFNQHNPI